VAKLPNIPEDFAFRSLKTKFSERVVRHVLVALNEIFPRCWVRFFVPLALTFHDSNICRCVIIFGAAGRLYIFETF